MPDIQDMEFQPGNPDIIYACSNSNTYKSVIGGGPWLPEAYMIFELVGWAKIRLIQFPVETLILKPVVFQLSPRNW